MLNRAGSSPAAGIQKFSPETGYFSMKKPDFRGFFFIVFNIAILLEISGAFLISAQEMPKNIY